MQRLVLRQAREADALEASRLLGQLGYRPDVRVVRESLERVAEAPDAHVIAATDGEQLLGLVALELSPCGQTPKPAGRLAGLVVTRSRRHQGIGRILLAAAEATASARGCSRLEITAARPAARGFLRRAGFAEGGGQLTKDLAPARRPSR